MKNRVIVILGPTSSGKSDLAVKIGLKIRGEVISADSRQVYKGLNLGTGKITQKEMKGVPHHLLDIANPKKVFSVVDYQKLTFLKIKEIINRGNVPILCGGTGFYIDAIVNGVIFPEVPANEKLRKKLAQKTNLELFKILEKIDKKRAKDIKQKNELNNKVRLIRAIEIAKVLGKVPEIKKERPEYQFIKIGLKVPLDILKERIQERLNQRIKNGMLKEIKNLHENGLFWKRMYELGLEYRYTALYLQKKLNKKEYLEKLNSEIYKYAKRQITYFKRDPKIIWFQVNKNLKKNVEKTIANFFKK